MKTNLKSKLLSLALMVMCLSVIHEIYAVENSAAVIDRANFATKFLSPSDPTNHLATSPDSFYGPDISAQRDITVWATNLPNNGAQKRMYRLDRDVRYKVRVSGFTHFGTWAPTKRALKNDACYEFNSRSSKISLPVIRTNFGFNFCSGSYKANHIYESQPVTGNGAYLVMSVYDTDYRDNYGDYYIEVIQLASRR